MTIQQWLLVLILADLVLHGLHDARLRQLYNFVMRDTRQDIESWKTLGEWMRHVDRELARKER